MQFLKGLRDRRGAKPSSQSHDTGDFLRSSLTSWTPGKSPLADEYLGKNYLKEMQGNSINAVEQIRNLAILATLTEQPLVLEPLIQHVLYRLASMDKMNFIQCQTISTLRWCSSQLGLKGYETLLDLTIAPDRKETASAAITQLVTNPDKAGRNWYGTIDEPTKLVTIAPVPRLDRLLLEMSVVAAYRQYPSGNDLGWTSKEFDEELEEDARFARKMLGVPIQPVPPEEVLSVRVPPPFTGFPPQNEEACD